ncbi:lariat debranching enzyme [Trichoderma cornu-damae]|uniref:Lariat debranching enzyme n=1 Tax=Trichoderma cornu-damae TaxID=654480 RepID=A0A9P8QPS5_9HYPO|nr:lariat debranching enzyme [Trichoderma cornu-damae]
MGSGAFESQGVRVAVEGCGHGTLNAIYASVKQSAQERGWDGVDLLIIGGDFQAVRNAADLTVMSCPVKYRHIGDFHEYYSGTRQAPYLTVFIGGNHEAASHSWELYYGGWAAPNIYYLGAANVLRLGPIRIAGMSGIWRGHNYRKPHHERLPFNADDVKSFYSIREVDVRKLLLLRTQVDVGLSHDWPRRVEGHGDLDALFRQKPFFRRESMDGSLGSAAAEYVMDRLRPPYWFSAHLHVKFAAVKRYDAPNPGEAVGADVPVVEAAPPVHQDNNPDEIDLDTDDQDVGKPDGSAIDINTGAPETEMGEEVEGTAGQVPDDLRAQLPASFARPAEGAKRIPGQPVPPGIENKEVRFLSLDKCLPRRHFLQLCEIQPFKKDQLSLYPAQASGPRYRLQYDAEWLAITRAFHKFQTFGDATAQVPEDLGEESYLPLIEAERAWVEENIVQKGKLDVPENFEVTAPPYVPGTPEVVQEQPEEYTNPQTAAFCELLGIENLWDASTEERQERRAQGPAMAQHVGRSGGGGRDGRGRERGGGRGGGRGGFRGRGRGQRGRQW